MELTNTAKNVTSYYCEKCYFSCKRKWDWNIHIKTAKHLSSLFGNKMGTNQCEITTFNSALEESNTNIICNCGKKYNTQSGLWKHKKNSKNDVCNNHSNQPSNNDFIKYLMNENKELKNIIMEMCKKENTTTL
jgi:hypothetical protein